MAIRSVATSSTLEGFRTTFNSLGTDVGDLSSLNTTNKTAIVAAINEVNSAVTTAFTIKDSSSTTQQINSGDVLNLAGSTNITAVVTATDTVTFSLASSISGLTNITSSNITLTGLAAASSDTDAFLVSDSNVVKTRTGAQVLTDIGGASTGFAIAQAVALG